MANFGVTSSMESPTVGQPVESPVPAFSTVTAAKPRETHCTGPGLRRIVSVNARYAGIFRAGEGAPSS